MADNWKDERNKIIGLGENSFKKNYYPELQNKIKELETSQKNLATIINSTSDGIIIHNKKGQILYLNDPAELLLNISFVGDESFTVMDVSSPKNNISEMPLIWNAVIEKQSLTIEWLILQNKTGKEIPVQMSISSTKWNKQQAFVAVIRDFTIWKEYEEKLKDAKEKAEESDNLKMAFLQNMSHEIRTPMNAIMGFSDLLNDPDLSPNLRKEYTSIIVNSSSQLLSVVDNILILSALQTKQERVVKTPLHVKKLLLDLHLIFAKGNLNNVLLQTSMLPSDEELIVVTDRTKLTQILTNLLANAIKFTHQGVIETGFRVKKDFLEFFVKDSGIGIDPTLHSKIFERFRQADRSIQINYGGTGLGLAISKAFVELLGGEIWVESTPGMGSTFFFTIPFQTGNITQVMDDSVSAENRPQTTILVAEDEETNYLYIEALLKLYHSSVIIHAKNGQEAVDHCKKYPEIKLVLMDIKMPIMDGFIAARLIKEFRPQLPIIAQTAYATEQDVKRFTKPVFDDYITKPLHKEELNTKLDRYIRNH